MRNAGPSTAFNHAENYFAVTKAFTRELWFETSITSRVWMNIGFVYLNVIRGWRTIVGHHEANLLEDAPCGLISNARNMLELHGGHARARIGHKKDGERPCP